MAIDVDSLTPKQLSDLIARAEQRQKTLDGARIEKARKKVTAIAKAEGFSIEELFADSATTATKTRGPNKAKGKAKNKAKKPPLPPKFRNPAAPTETWSGRGKRPRWYVAALTAGKKEKDLLIR